MQCEAGGYWKVKRDYAGEPFFRLDKDKLAGDLGRDEAEALTTFMKAHYAFNDADDPPSETEKQHLVTQMIKARAVLGEINPYLFVEALDSLKQGSGV